MHSIKRFRLPLILLLVLILMPFSACKKDEIKPDSSYAVKFDETDEDYVDFGAFQGFTFNSDWAIIEKVKFSEGASAGWHFFRGLGWEDKVGDIAISINEDRVHAWVYSDQSWVNAIKEANYTSETWYTICLQYTLSTTTLDLYINGSLEATLTAGPFDDANNTNKLFWGGQDVAPGAMEGDLYSETSCTIAHQAWYQRLLTSNEISAYSGSVDDSDTSLFFSSDIGSTGVSDASGNGHSGLNGNSPEFITY